MCTCSLKSANILLDRQHRAKLADVGLAKTLSNMHAGTLATMMATAELGTFSWAAPEVSCWHVCARHARRAKRSFEADVMQLMLGQRWWCS